MGIGVDEEGNSLDYEDAKIEAGEHSRELALKRERDDDGEFAEDYYDPSPNKKVRLEFLNDTQPPVKKNFCEECKKHHEPAEFHLPCQHCGELFVRTNLLNLHMRRVHGIPIESNIKRNLTSENYDETNPNHCHFCRKAIESETYKMFHDDTAHREFKEDDHFYCRLCSYKTKIANSL